MILSEADHPKDRNWLIWVIILFSLITFLFHNEIDQFLESKGFWFKGNSIFIWLMSIQILALVRKKAIAFILFGYALNNMLDELFFNPLETEVNEIVFAVLIPIIAWIIYKKHDTRKRNLGRVKDFDN